MIVPELCPRVVKSGGVVTKIKLSEVRLVILGNICRVVSEGDVSRPPGV